MSMTQFWFHADGLSKGLFLILLGLSVLTWTVFLLRLRATRLANQTMSPQLTQTISQLLAGTDAQILSFEQRKALIEQALLQQLARRRVNLERGLSTLGSVAAISPFLGLFGTVWGVFHALANIGNTGQAGLAQVAAPVGEALIMTGVGLAVAIPAVLAYNLCLRINRVAMQRLQDQAHRLLINQWLPSYCGDKRTPVQKRTTTTFAAPVAVVTDTLQNLTKGSAR